MIEDKTINIEKAYSLLQQSYEDILPEVHCPTSVTCGEVESYWSKLGTCDTSDTEYVQKLDDVSHKDSEDKSEERIKVDLGRRKKLKKVI